MPFAKDKTKAHEKLIKYEVINGAAKRGGL
jgi:hypothetical protein